MTKSEIVDDAVQKFSHLPNRTIAWYIFYNYGDLFDGNLENIRTAVRYRMGALGEEKRTKATIIRNENPKLPLTWRTARTRFKLKPGRYLVFGDTHVPFHEIKPIEAMVKYAQAQQITGKLLAGDIQDCASISYWASAKKRDFDKEVAAFIEFLDWLQKELPTEETIYMPGNHEYRLPRLFQAKVPELIGLPLAAMTDFLGLEERGIELLDYNQIVMAGKLPIIHGHEVRAISRAVNPARGLFLKAKTWAMCFHCHTTSEHTAKNINEQLLTTWSVGCLCDLNPDYNPFGNDWCWGFAIINIEKNGNFTVENHRILANGDVV